MRSQSEIEHERVIEKELPVNEVINSPASGLREGRNRQS